MKEKKRRLFFLKFDHLRSGVEWHTMSHTYFCCNAHCPNGTTIHAMKCSGCLAAWYCGETCQKKDWPNHKTDCHAASEELLERELFAGIAKRLDRDCSSYPYEHFQRFMKHHSYRYSTRTTQEWIEDWLGGWYTEDRERKELLRQMFHANGLKWSLDAYPYCTWSELQSGNRFEKMTTFIKMSKALF